jgi:hypothetical protein
MKTKMSESKTSEPKITETDIKLMIAQAILEYDKERSAKAEKSMWKTLKTFVGKNFQTIIIVALLFYALGGAKLFDNMIGKMFSVQINNALIQKIIPDKTDRVRFIDRIQKLFERDYANEDQFESDYRQTTADFRYKYPALREKVIRNKKQLTEFTMGNN